MIFFFVMFFSTELLAKVDPPNFEFSTDTLSAFFPGKTLPEIETKFGRGEVLREGDVRLLRFWVTEPRYRFAVLVQTDQEKVLDMFAKLPSYFLHDVFHHSLIQRWGKQQKYLRVDEEAYYRWQGPEQTMHYAASCTITCFPMYFSVTPSQTQLTSDFTPLHQQLLASP